MAYLIAEIIGYIAAAVGTSLMLPQVIKSLKTKQVRDISLLMLIIYLVNCVLWATYGILIVAWPVIICNFIALVIGFVQIWMKIRYDKGK